MSSVLCLSLLVAVLLFVGRYCSAFSVPEPFDLGVHIPRNGIWHPEITEESPFSLEGVAGSSLGLPCNITAPTPDDSVVRVLWFKDGAMTPFYTLDAIRIKLNRARHTIDFHLKDRAHLSIDRQPAVLQFNLLKEEEDGEYSCRVDFRKARTRYFDLILTVIVPPKKPVIMNEHGELIHGVTGLYNSDRVYLVCETEGGKPTPSLTWWVANVLLDDTYEVSNEGVVRNDIVITVERQSDVLRSVFTCQATNNRLTAPVSSYVTLDMKYTASVSSSEEINMNSNESTSLTMDIINEVIPITLKYGYHEVVKTVCPISNRATSGADYDNDRETQSSQDISPLRKFGTDSFDDEDAVYRDRIMNARSSPCPLCVCSESKDRSSEETSDVSTLSKSGDFYKRK